MAIFITYYKFIMVNSNHFGGYYLGISLSRVNCNKLKGDTGMKKLNRFRMNMGNNAYLNVETFRDYSKGRIMGLYNKLYYRTKSYIAVKEILARDYGIFIRGE